jgi:hypothetical protein
MKTEIFEILKFWNCFKFRIFFEILNFNFFFFNFRVFEVLKFVVQWKKRFKGQFNSLWKTIDASIDHRLAKNAKRS